MPYRASDYDPNFTGPVNPGADLEESQLARLLGLDMPEMDTRQETVQQPSRLGQFFEGFSGLEESPALARPTTFAQGLVSGAARGLGGAGTRARLERDKLEQAGRVRQATRDERNFEATRRYRESREKGLQEMGKESRAAASKKADYDLKNPPPGTPEYRIQMQRITDEERAKTAGQPVKPEKVVPPYDPDNLFKIEAAIRTNPDIKKFRDIKFGYDLVSTGAGLNTPQGDLSLIFGYMKMLDPESVVREGEFANAENTRGVPEMVRQRYNRLLSGDKLSPQQRTEFTSAAEAIFKKVRPASDQASGRYRKQAKAFSVPEELLFEAEVANPAEARTTTPVAPAGRPDPASFWRP